MSPVITAVLFDFGGVVTTSPFDNFARLEAELGIPKDTIRTINATNPDENAWAKLERSEISLEEFDESGEVNPMALYRSYFRRQLAADYRRIAGTAGPQHTAESYLMIVVLDQQ